MRAEIKHVGGGKVKVVIYVRVSTQEQANEGYSIGEQIERLTKYCEAMGWVIIETYIDPGYSGGSTDRPALQKMIKDLEAGDVDKVVVYKLDRLSRSQKDTLLLIEDVFLKNNTDFVSMNENFDTSTPFGRAMIGILAVFAQLEREQIKERMGMGKEARAKEGRWHGSIEPIGYNYNAADNMLYINEYERMQILELYDLFLGGTQLRTIETMFREKGYKHKHGVWDPKAMRRVLANKLNIGLLKHRDTWYQGTHEPLIDEERFNKAVALLDARKEAYKALGVKSGAQTTYLGGLLYCKHCGGKYAKTSGGSKTYGKLIYYVCHSRNGKVKKMIKDPNCRNKNWRMEALDDIVLGEIKKLAIDPEYFNRIRETEKEKKRANSEEPDKATLIQSEIEKIDDQISRFMDLYGIGKFTVEQVSKKVDPLNEQRNALARELERLAGAENKLTKAEVIDITKSFPETLERGVFEEIRLVIDSLIERIELDDEDVHIHWKF